VGEALEPFRSQIVIATKFGWKIDPSSRKSVGLDSRPEHIKQVADSSLKRLRVDTINESTAFASSDIRAIPSVYAGGPASEPGLG
jgi:hypothetical protein